MHKLCSDIGFNTVHKFKFYLLKFNCEKKTFTVFRLYTHRVNLHYNKALYSRLNAPRQRQVGLI